MGDTEMGAPLVPVAMDWLFTDWASLARGIKFAERTVNLRRALSMGTWVLKGKKIDRERERDRDGEREREIKRKRETETEREREREREREKKRDKEKERKRERERERERDKARKIER